MSSYVYNINIPETVEIGQRFRNPLQMECTADPPCSIVDVRMELNGIPVADISIQERQEDNTIFVPPGSGVDNYDSDQLTIGQSGLVFKRPGVYQFTYESSDGTTGAQQISVSGGQLVDAEVTEITPPDSIPGEATVEVAVENVSDPAGEFDPPITRSVSVVSDSQIAGDSSSTTISLQSGQSDTLTLNVPLSTPSAGSVDIELCPRIE